MRLPIRGLCSCALALTFLASAYTASAQTCDATPVVFNDANLVTAIRGALSKPTGTITTGDMCNLNGSLELQDRQISDLTGLEYAFFVTDLNLSNNQIGDLSPVTQIGMLHSLDISSNHISALDAVSGLALISLTAHDNQIVSVSPLAAMTTLHTLDLSNNLVTDLTGLTGLTSLTNLSIPNNGLVDLGGLAGCTALTSVTLSNNHISDVSVFSTLTGVHYLDLGYNYVADVTGLTTLTAITNINLTRNRVVRIEELAANASWGSNTYLEILGNPLDGESVCTTIAALQTAGVAVQADQECTAGTANDECAGAIAVQLNQRVWGSTSAATGSTDLSSCATGDTIDVWYSFAPAASGSYVIDLSGSAFDTTLSVFSDCGTTQVACDDNSGDGNTSKVSASLNNTTTYLIRISGVNGDFGSYTLNVAPAACGNSDVISFNDAALETAIRSQLGKFTGDILNSDLCPLTEIIANNEGIQSINALSACTHLDTLNLAGNPIGIVSLLTVIPALSTLTSLDLSNTNTNGFANFASLHNLREVAIDNDHVTQLPTMTAGFHLRRLSANNNSISDLTPLSGVNTLEELELNQNSVVDLTPLLTLTGLTRLFLGQNLIVDTSTAASLPNLQNLVLDGNNLSDAPGFTSAPALQIISLADNRLSNISSLANAPNLVEVHVNDNHITDLSPLASTTTLTTLYAGENQILYTDPLQNLTSLMNLDISENQITDLTALLLNTGFGNQTYVNITGNPLTAHAACVQIPALQTEGVTVGYDQYCTAGSINEDSASALPILAGYAVYGATSTAAGTGSSSCGNGGDHIAVWYYYFATADTTAHITLCDSEFDTTLAVYDSTVSTELACNDEGECGSYSSLDLPVVNGAEYFIRVAGYNAVTGNYKLLLTIPQAGEGEGEGEGAAEGEGEGAAEGEGEGAAEGEGEGAAEGEGEGAAEGEGEGAAEGEGEGATEGEGEGAAEGEGEGAAEGEGEGAAEGEGEDAAEGEGEGAGSGEGEGEGACSAIVTSRDLMTNFATADTNHDGFLSLAEAQAAEACLTQDGFNALDSGGDGSLQPSELLQTGGPGFLQSADENGDFVVSLGELLRTIQFYNAGGYHCSTNAGASEDGYESLPDPSAQSCLPYATDYMPQDWQISLQELLRLIQIYNAGGYHYCPNEVPVTEDNFCPGL